MNAPIRMSMFQCMALLEDMPPIRDMWRRLSASDDCINLLARPPGSLHLTIEPDKIDKMQIGSIHFKMVHHGTNLSFIVFGNKKVKISGGLQKMDLFDSTTDFWEFVTFAFLDPCLLLILGQETSVQITSGMVNASCRIGSKLAFDTYLTRLDRVQTLQRKTIILPLCLTKNLQRGRTCSVRIKRADKMGTLIVDHHLTLQAFAYRDMEVLRRDVEEIHCVFNDTFESETANDVFNSRVRSNECT